MRFHLGGGIYLIILNPSFHQYWPNTARILQRRKLVQGPRTLLDNVNDLWASFSPLGSFINQLDPLVWTYTFSPPPTPPWEFFSKAALPRRRAWKPPLLCLCMCLEPWIQTDHGNWASLNFGIQDRSWNQSPSDTDGQVYSRHPFSLLQLCSEWEGMTFLGGLWKPLPQSTVNILSRFLVPWKSFIPMMLFLFSLTQSPVLQEKKFSCWKQ